MVQLLGPYIAERIITSFKTNVNLKVEIVADTSKHAEDRKFRHEREITDSEIRATVVKATEEIMQSFINGDIKEGDRFLIYDPANNHLNLVATFHMNQSGTPEKIRIITMMRNKNFKANDIKRIFKI